jgi:acetyltransferase EpsM
MAANPASGGAIRVAIFGGRGGGCVAAQIVRDLEAAGAGVRLHGLLNDAAEPGERLSGTPVLGPFSSWKDQPEDVRFAAPLHKAGSMVERAARIRGLGVPVDRWITLVDPRANVAADVRLGPGCVVSGPCVLQPGVRVGAHVAVRSGAAVAHDCRLGDSAFIGLNATVCGYATVCEGAHVSPGAVVREGIRIGAWSVVGLGAVVIADVPDGAVVVGNPARPVGSVDAR